MFDIEKLNTEYQELLEKLYKIFELKKKYSTKVLWNLERKNAYLTLDRQTNGLIEINLRNSTNGIAVCGVISDEINEPLEHFETNLKTFQEEFLKKKKEKELEIMSKGFTELETIKVGDRNVPMIRIVKSSDIIDWHTHKTIGCTWELPINKSTADKIMKLKKRDLVLSWGDTNFIIHKIRNIELTTNKTTDGFNVCFGMVVEFKNGEKI
jgi:hypothetical protein